MYVSVIGAADCGRGLGDLAYRVGREVARRRHVLVCGGLGGVMDAAAHGAHDAGGLSVGILPGPDRAGASGWLSVAVPTDMGQARNALVALAGDAIIAVGGGYGTLSEVALGLKMGRPVIGLETWELDGTRGEGPGIVRASDPESAVSLAEELATGGTG